MSQREKTLAFLVGGAVFVLLNVVLIRFFMAKYEESSQAKAKAAQEMKKFQLLESERETSAKRDIWLTAQLVPMGDSDVANKMHREAVQEVAKKHQVLIDNISAGVPNRMQSYVSLGLRMECKGKWDNISYFLNELQGHDKFIVVEAFDLKVDPADKTQLRASMTVAKWYSPKG